MSINLEAIRRQFEEHDQFASTNGARLVELRQGFARAVMAVEERHWNSLGTVQGGAIFMLADFAFGAASNSGGKVAVGINTTMSFMKATRSGTLTAEATEISRTRRTSTCTVRVTNESGELVAFFQGTAYIKDEAFPAAEHQP